MKDIVDSPPPPGPVPAPPPFPLMACSCSDYTYGLVWDMGLTVIGGMVEVGEGRGGSKL